MWNFIDEQQKVIFEKLKKDNYLVGLNKTEFIKKIVLLSSELNALHPFREGNGRTIRCFLKILADNTGYEMNIFDVKKEELMAGDVAAYNFDYNPLIEIYSRIIVPKESQNE